MEFTDVSMDKWSCTGQPLVSVPLQVNNRGFEFLPGLVINFNICPVKFLDSSILKTWLMVCGIKTGFENQNELVMKVNEVASLDLEILPIQGQRGYISF